MTKYHFSTGMKAGLLFSCHNCNIARIIRHVKGGLAQHMLSDFFIIRLSITLWIFFTTIIDKEPFYITKKRLRSKASKAFLRFRRRLNFPGSCPPSIFSAKELNYCVRYGNRCDLLAIVTEYISTFRQYISLSRVKNL